MGSGGECLCLPLCSGSCASPLLEGCKPVPVLPPLQGDQCLCLSPHSHHIHRPSEKDFFSRSACASICGAQAKLLHIPVKSLPWKGSPQLLWKLRSGDSDILRRHTGCSCLAQARKQKTLSGWQHWLLSKLFSSVVSNTLTVPCTHGERY